MKYFSEYKYRLISYLILITCMVLLALFPLPLVFGVSISLAAFIYLVMIRLYGFREALLAAVILTLLSYFGGIGHSYMFTSVFEVLVIGGLYKVKGKDLFTWSFVYSFLLIIVVLLLELLTDIITLSANLVLFLLFFFIVSTIFASLVADMFCDYFPYLKSLNKFFPNKEKLYFGQIISHLLILAAITPILLIILTHAKMLEEDVYKEWEEKTIAIENRLQIKASELDNIEVQNFMLDSDLEKARLKVLLDPFVLEDRTTIFVLDQQLNEWLRIGESFHYQIGNPEFLNGYITVLNEKSTIWFSKKRSTLGNWTDARYIGHTTYLNKDVFVVMPTEDKVIEVLSEIKFYLLLSFVVLIVALVLGVFTNFILTKALGTINTMTREIPNRVESNESLKWSSSSIVEFSILISNLQKVSNQIQNMFHQTKKQNIVLKNQTEQLIESESQLYLLAHYDTLTKLPNRRSFYEKVTERIENDNVTKFVIVFLDLNHFKQVNDTLGHSGGDELLSIFATRLSEFAKRYPYVSVFRLAGDEFVAIIDQESTMEIQATCVKFSQIFDKPIFIQNKSIELSASIGLSIYPDDGKGIDQLLHKADTLMYEQKQQRKNEDKGGE